ncbi:MAG: N-acetylmuramoyl-L-alanine amidase family protein [Candidatus Hydrothermia bacterium]
MLLVFFLQLLLSFETVKFNPINVGGVDYISYVDIAQFLGARTFVSDSSLELYSATKKVRINFQSKVAMLSQESVPLDNIYIDDNTLYLDGETWGYILSWLVEAQKYYWDYQNKRYIISRYPPSVKSFSLYADSVVIEYNRDLSPLVFQSGDTIYVFIKRGFYNGLASKKVYGEFIKAVRTRHTSEGVTFLITLENGVKYESSTRVMSLVLRFKKEAYKKGYESPSESLPPEVPQIVQAPEKAYERKIKVIVIDPGHGGQDPGAVANGVREKDVVLKVAKLVAQRLEKMGLKVILTRTGDYFVTLGERARIAKKYNADIFVSIHCNYAPSSRAARGIETYFLSEARTEWERSVAAFENSVIKYEVEKNVNNNNILTMILGDMAQYEFLKESQDLAYFIQESLVNSSFSVDRGVKQAGFYVLQGVYAPSILVELGFLTNRDEARRLTDSRYQEKLADAIVDGIIKFKINYERQ